MRWMYIVGGYFALHSFACSGSAGFSTSEKVNGREPSPAVYPIFGLSKTVEEGVPLSAVALIASDHKDLCSELEKEKDWLDGLTREPNDTTMVLNIFVKEGDMPKSGQTFNDDVLVSLFFAFQDEKPVTFAVNDGIGTISFDKLSDSALTGRISTNLSYEIIEDKEIDVQLVGSVQRASRCKALDDIFDDDTRREQILNLVKSQHSAL